MTSFNIRIQNLRPDYSFDHLKINTETHRDLNDKTRILPKVNVRIPNCGFYYAEKQFIPPEYISEIKRK